MVVRWSCKKKWIEDSFGSLGSFRGCWRGLFEDRKKGSERYEDWEVQDRRRSVERISHLDRFKGTEEQLDDQDRSRCE